MRKGDEIKLRQAHHKALSDFQKLIARGDVHGLSPAYLGSVLGKLQKVDRQIIKSNMQYIFDETA